VPEVEVRLVDVVKRFGDAVAVDHIDLEVRDGEFFSLLGPSGCGKTTTLRMIGGFEQPTSGLIELQGRDVTWLPPYQRNVNTVFQSYALFPHLTIFENVAFGLRRRRVKDSEIKSRVSEMLSLVELPGFERRKPTQISGGQAQRVALARALINRPAVLLLDEPLGALDLKLRKQMQVELKRIQQEVGITFIYVTHDQEEAMTMSDRIAVMNRGRYEQLGDPESLYERPTTRFVAGFLGISNLLPATVAGSDDTYALARIGDASTVRVPKAYVNGQQSIEVGVRPEKIRMHKEDDAPAADFNQLDGTVVDASYLGVSTSDVVEARSGARLTIYEQNVERTVHGSLHRPGETVHLSWSPDHTFVVRADPVSIGQADA
jgi:spermidine/putrescine transport system ATP-binding protein